MSNISFKRLKTEIKSRGQSLLSVAKYCGVSPTHISGVCTGVVTPRSDLLAKMCAALQVYPSELVDFEGIKINEEYFAEGKRKKLPAEFKGELTYKPLWLFLTDYLAEVNEGKEVKKTENDLFDQIDPPRRIRGLAKPDSQTIKKAVAARFGEGYVAKRQNRKKYDKGLPAATRTKLRHDRPLNLAVIYEICKFLGCSVDWVISYK